MFRLPFLVLVALVVAFGGGIWSTLVALDATTGFGAIRLGAWEAFPQAQTADADPYAKAHRANGGRLLYGTAEGLSFTASVDQTGQRLSGRCTYLLSGQTPVARAWTLFAATVKGAAPLTGQDLPVALNSRTVLRDATGAFIITLSPDASAGNWLAVPRDGPFYLTLTLLDTPTAGSSGLIDLAMPRIDRIGCAHA
ncbi:hypothetical protein J2858_000437 [Neorhizobium galegae]|uniref:DUF1214 domain-containing protein n=1 Tax=Neorhizobium galegae TaxID=399 RepID=UPI001AE3037A|nr:DUF1214 domain-containing protein [Neorhizobium galegae]MBP2547544.1 hypothetical protein [Neorhizobium galegae]